MGPIRCHRTARGGRCWVRHRRAKTTLAYAVVRPSIHPYIHRFIHRTTLGKACPTAPCTIWWLSVGRGTPATTRRWRTSGWCRHEKQHVRGIPYRRALDLAISCVEHVGVGPSRLPRLVVRGHRFSDARYDDKQTNTNKRASKQANTQTHKQTNEQASKQTHKQTHKQTNKQTHTQTNEQTKIRTQNISHTRYVQLITCHFSYTERHHLTLR